jgi:small subunit ribosomal protein S1
VKIVDHEDLTSFIRRSDLSRDRDEQRPERFSVGEKVDARVTQFDEEDPPQGRPVDQGAGNRRREGSRRTVRLVRLRRIARRHSRRDLKQIKGVGPAFEKKLNDAGVFHFWQIASMTDDQLAALEEEVGTSGKGADWKAEAAALQG